jgi:very-short-patch-repair endonuclease
VPQLEKARGLLNGHVATLHKGIEPSGINPFRMLGALALLGERGRDIGEVDFADAHSWDASALQDRRAVISELAQRSEQMGQPSAHPWRGAEREVILNIDLPRIREALADFHLKLGNLRASARQIAALIRQPEPECFYDVGSQRELVLHISVAPTMDRRALCHGIWKAGMSDLRGIIEHGRAFSIIRQNLANRVVKDAFETDLTAERSEIASKGKSIFRIFSGVYRNSIGRLRNIASGGLPRGFSDRLSLLDNLIDGRRHLLFIVERDSAGRDAFGESWQRENSDWEHLSAIINWVNENVASRVGDEFREAFRDLDPKENFKSIKQGLDSLLAQALSAFGVIGELVGLNIEAAFGVDTVERVPFVALEERLSQWSARLEDITRWNTWFVHAKRARKLGLGILVSSIESGKVSSNRVSDVFEKAFYSKLFREAVRTHPEIARFDGLAHDRLVSEFRRLDLERIALAKHRILARHFENLPARNAGIGATGILLAEFQRRRGHRPIRKLLRDSGSVIQAIKPVFMMSPLSVSQFLEPGAIEFDVLIIDEASQVQPVDAFGAVARAKQHIVVGDNMQLPPTRFFTRMTSNDDGNDEICEDDMPAAQAGDVESILGLCRARGLNPTMLRWHYRSRHHSLIAVSNREFYDDKLFIIPSPRARGPGLGLEFQFVEGGVYGRGGSRTNPIEARAVSAAVMKHAREHPDKSLGVAAFSMPQQQAILDELELLRRQQPELEEFFHSHPHEPFFVKNLENVQGDERDVIFISVGYGPDASRFISMDFGPLSRDGGERRLNVLISRAKESCRVFSSIRAADVDLSRGTGHGVRAFKTFLEFADSGILGIAEKSGKGEDSDFEVAVRRSIESLGYEVHPQVGVAGFFIDLGVVDPQMPGRYLLGIECDGASYHSSKSARNRDRLRQTVLEDHGWVIHRIWSTDWFQRPGEQLRKVAAAIELARVADSHPGVTAVPQIDDKTPLQRDSRGESEDRERQVLATPYIEAQISVPRHIPPHALEPVEMAEVLMEILAVEAPIHIEELTVRVRELWGLGRAGSRIQDAVRSAATLLVEREFCVWDGSCITFPGPSDVVRNRERVASASLRKPEYLPPQEIRMAIIRIVSAYRGAARDETITAVARLLGFQSTSAQLREIIEGEISRLVADGILMNRSGMLAINSDAQNR